MIVDLLVLNFNGRELLAECLPTVLRAAETSQHQCRVAVIDNASTDDSLALLAEHFPHVAVYSCKNRGLCSFNDVLPRLAGTVAVLLNNDIKLADDCLDPLVKPLKAPTCWMTAPLCWQFDGRTYDGQRTAVRWRWGLVQATWQFPGYEQGIHLPGETASAGAALAVDRAKFLELGGFDPRYLPGRLEDLDLAYRGYLAGYHARYVPQAVAYHRGQATFDKVLGRQRCDQLTLRNTLLFQWKHLRHPWHVAQQVAGAAMRLTRDLLVAPCRVPSERFAFARALRAAWSTWRLARQHDSRRGATCHTDASDTYKPAAQASASAPMQCTRLRFGLVCARGTRLRCGLVFDRSTSGLERKFFRQFHPRALSQAR